MAYRAMHAAIAQACIVAIRVGLQEVCADSDEKAVGQNGFYEENCGEGTLAAVQDREFLLKDGP